MKMRECQGDLSYTSEVIAGHDQLVKYAQSFSKLGLPIDELWRASSSGYK